MTTGAAALYLAQHMSARASYAIHNPNRAARLPVMDSTTFEELIRALFWLRTANLGISLG